MRLWTKNHIIDIMYIVYLKLNNLIHRQKLKIIHLLNFILLFNQTKMSLLSDLCLNINCK